MSYYKNNLNVIIFTDIMIMMIHYLILVNYATTIKPEYIFML